MRESIITVIVKIRDGQADDLRRFLRENIDPTVDPDGSTVECKPDMRFDRLSNLHFASFSVLDDEEDETAPDDRFGPCLVFEATVDGDIDEFINALIEHAGDGLDRIFERCEGYPESGHALPHLVRQYLKEHDVGYNVFYSGHPGRTVAGIRGENTLRERIVDFIRVNRDRPGALDTTLRAIQRQIQRRLVRRDRTDEREDAPSSQWITPKPRGPQAESDLRWVEDLPAEPFAVAQGRTLIKAGSATGLVVVALLLLFFSGYDFAGLDSCISNAMQLRDGCVEPAVTGLVPRAINAVVTLPFHAYALIVDLVAAARDAFGASEPPWLEKWFEPTLAWNLVVLLLSWAVLRLLRFGLNLWEEPETHGLDWVLNLWLRHAVVILQLTYLGILVAMSAAVLPVFSPSHAGQPGSWIIASGFVAALIVLGLLWALLRYVKTLPLLVQIDPHESVLMRGLRTFSVDVGQVFMLVPIWYIVLVLVWWLDLQGTAWLAFIARLAVGLVAVFATGALLGLLGLAVSLVILLLFYLEEQTHDRIKYEDANILIKVPVGSEHFEREGYGINKVQNHLVSLSYIKGGMLRRFRLRVVLLVINLMSRWWYNRGDLGGVPNIHFLRWIIVDKGRRLLFLDNYHGSWEGYLDAFIDGGAVKGMNAIWSHTYIYPEDLKKRVGFPRTSCMMWRGARDERPFKEIVRNSQSETLAWYSAYPFLSGVNITTNSEIRNALFQDLDTAELDRLSQRLR
jgi:hypothetical protein